MNSLSRLDLIQKQIEFTRNYTLTLLEDLEIGDWFWHPAEAVTHIAWQVGHLAMAQYGLTLFRQRGRQPIDTEIMTSKFRKQFSKGSTPVADPDANPSIEEIRGVFDAVFAQAMKEIPTYQDSQLDDKVDPPHAVFDTRYGALLFCPNHEMLHAGQIGLLRRLMGKDPLR